MEGKIIVCCKVGRYLTHLRYMYLIMANRTKGAKRELVMGW
jgi:hypothetical protein